MNKTEKEIIGLCKKEWLPSTYFMKKIDRTITTTAKNLKRLYNQNILERKTGQELDYLVWVYYYRLNNPKECLDYWREK